jgi:hypothetical protein
MPSRLPAATTTGRGHEYNRRRRARLIAIVAATATLVGIAAGTGSPAAAAPRMAQAKTSNSSATANPQGVTAAAALAQAKQTKAPVVATAMTTPTEQATANPNGTLTLTQSNQPTRVRKNGAWVNLDPTLTRNPDGSYSPNATPSQVTLSGGGTSALATLSTSGEELDITVPMTLPAPTVSGATATYPNVLPDVDLTATISDQGGFSDAFVVKTAAAAANPALASVQLGATSRHLRLTADAHGGVAAVDSAGHPAYSVAAPIMWDSTPPPASSKAAAKTPRALAQADSGTPVDANSGLPLDSSPTAPGEAAHTAPIGLATSSSGLTLTPSQSLLTASNTVYPVYLDPTLTPDAYGGVEADWLEVQSGYPNTSVWRQSGYQQVGDCAWGGCNGMGTARSFFDWNISPLYGTKVFSSQVNFTEVWAPACTPPSGHNAAVALEWTGLLNGGQTWNNQPSPINWTGLDNTGMYGYDPNACPSAGIGFDVTNQVIADVNGQTGDIALGLLAADESDPYGWKLFSNTAILSTTYDVTPATPSGPFTSPVLPCTTTKPYPIIGKTDLYLYIGTPEAADNVAKPLGLDFAVKNLATGAVVYDQTIQTTAGASASTTVPQGTLTNGDYTWDTQSFDGSIPSATSTPCDLTVDTSQPGPPGVTSNDSYYPNDKVGKPVRTPGQFKFTPAAGQPTPAAYRYQIDDGVPITVTAGNDGSWIGMLTPEKVGISSLTVQALSPAGTPSAATGGYDIDAAPLLTPDPDGDLTGDGNPDLLTVGSPTAGGIPPGLWLSAGDGNGHLAPPTDIGVFGTSIDSSGSASDWNGAVVTHGQFTGDKMQDILAIPTDGKPEIFPSPGDGTALQPASRTGVPNYDGYLVDSNGTYVTSSENETITQITAIGHLPTAGGTTGDINAAYPDLIAVVHDTNTDADPNHPYQLWWFQNNGATGNFSPAYPLDHSIDWSTKTITGTSYQGKPALIVRDNATGGIDLYPTCATNACDDSSWFSASVPIPSTANASATTAATAPQIASEDVNNATDTNGNPVPDLWAIGSNGAVTTSWGGATGTFNTGAPIAAGNVAGNPLTPAGAIRWQPPGSGQDQVDVYATDTNGRLWDYQEQPNAYLAVPKLVGSGTWNTLTSFGIADWNHDGYPDIVARDNTSCALNVYPGSAIGLSSTPTQIGAGWCGLTPFGVADWYHNGHQDIVARDDATGILWLYPGDLTGGNGSRVSIGSGFTAGTLDPYGLINFDGATDASGNPANEIIVRRDTDHTLQLFRGNGTNNPLTASGIQIGSGFTTDYTFVGFLHYNIKIPTEPDLITREPNTHNLQLFEGNDTGTWANGLGTTIITSGW